MIKFLKCLKKAYQLYERDAEFRILLEARGSSFWDSVDKINRGKIKFLPNGKNRVISRGGEIDFRYSQHDGYQVRMFGQDELLRYNAEAYNLDPISAQELYESICDQCIPVLEANQ